MAHKWARWPTSGQSGYITPAAWGVPTASERGAESEVAHKWARWLHNPCRLGGPHRFRAGGRIRSGPQVGSVGRDGRGYVATVPTCRPFLILSPGAKHWGPPRGHGLGSHCAHMWAISDFVPRAERWGPLRRQGLGSHCAATQPLPPGGCQPLQSGGQNQKWPTSGQGGYITPATWWVPTASERGAESEMAHKWARWLHNPCCLGGPHRFRAGGRIRSGPQVGKVAT